MHFNLVIALLWSDMQRLFEPQRLLEEILYLGWKPKIMGTRQLIFEYIALFMVKSKRGIWLSIISTCWGVKNSLNYPVTR